MPWKELSTKQLAKKMGIDIHEVKEKQRLMKLIAEARKSKGLSQTALAKKVGVTQSRIAQIESGIGTAKITYDILFHVLSTLGYKIEIQEQEVA